MFLKNFFSKKTTKTKQVFGIPIYLQTGIRTAKTLLRNLLKIDRTLNSHNNTEFTITLKVSDI